jgi:sterol desaturase/sphingolipid hydroxylase (fatty acid hydroxylase superfamily)
MNPFLINLAVVITTMAVASLIESGIPFFARPGPATGRRAANLAFTVVVFTVNWILSSAAAILALTLGFQPANLLAPSLPLAARILLGVLILDFSAGYLAHRTLHMIPAMWRFHRIHHSDDFVDVTTTYRTHPVESVWRFLFSIIPVWLLGIPAQAVLIQRLAGSINGVLEHSNVRLWAPLDRVLSIVWVTPNVHKIHHSRELSETNSNYGNILTLHDRVFGTYTSSDRAESVVYGLDDADPAQIASFPRLMAMPFRERRAGRLTQKTGSAAPSIDNIPA